MNKRPSVIAANKMDLPEAAANLKAFRRKVRRKVVPISAETGAGIPELKRLISEMCRGAKT